MTNQQVISAFLLDREGKSKSLTSSKRRLYSYGVIIAERKFGCTRIFDYTASGDNFISNTTSRHVSQTIIACLDRNITPDIRRP